MTTPADELRAAAQTLRGLVAAVDLDMAADPYWSSGEHPPHAHPTLYARGVDGGLGGPAGAFAAAMHPGVGSALAAWLQSWVAIDLREDAALPEDAQHAIDIARQINGSAS